MGRGDEQEGLADLRGLEKPAQEFLRRQLEPAKAVMPGDDDEEQIDIG